MVRPIIQRENYPAPARAGEVIDSKYLPGAMELSFAFGDATPLLIGTLEAGERASLVRLDIYAAFNGAGATLTVGALAAPDSLMAATQNDPTQVATYEQVPMQVPVNTDIYLFITPGSGASAGSGHVLVRAQL